MTNDTILKVLRASPAPLTLGEIYARIPGNERGSYDTLGRALSRLKGDGAVLYLRKTDGGPGWITPKRQAERVKRTMQAEQLLAQAMREMLGGES